MCLIVRRVAKAAQTARQDKATIAIVKSGLTECRL